MPIHRATRPDDVPDVPPDAEPPQPNADAMTQRQGERGPPAPPRRDETGVETEGTADDDEVDEDEDPDLGFVDDARRDSAPDAESTPGTDRGRDDSAP